MIEYVIKSTVSITILYLLYLLFLKNIKTFKFNRFYLLFAILFSFIIPFIQITTDFNLAISQSIEDYSSSINNISVQGTIEKEQINNTLNLHHILYVVYILISCILSFRFVFNLYKITNTIKNSKIVVNTLPHIILSTDKTLPYSFLNYIIVNITEFENGKIDNSLISHEQAHCKQYHSLDILLVEIVKIIFWFNPVIWIIKKELQLNHEYLADKRVLQSQNLKDYQNILLNLVFRNNSTYLASDLNFSLTKKRLIMMKRKESLVKTIVRQIAIFPLVYLLAVTITYGQKTIPKDSLKNYEKEWWFPIIEKHNIQISAFNNFEYIFEMGKTNSINNKIVSLNNALFIVRHNDFYEIIQVNEGTHDLQKGILSGDNGTIQKCYFNSNKSEPAASFKSFKYQLTPEGYGARLTLVWN